MCPEDGGTSSLDCMLSEWTGWSECSTTCDEGLQVRQRMVKRPAQEGGASCDGELKEMRPCNSGSCDIGDYDQCMVNHQNIGTCGIAQ